MTLRIILVQLYTQYNTKMLQDLVNTINTDTKKNNHPNTTYSEASISQQDDRHTSRNAYYQATCSDKKPSIKKHSNHNTYSEVRIKHDLANFSINSDSSQNSSESNNSPSPLINSETISQFRIPPVPFFTPQPCPQYDISKFNREMKSITIESEDYLAVKSLYDDVQQSIIAATKNPGIIPYIDYLTPSFRFDKFMVPPKGSASYRLGIKAYITMAKALKKNIMKPSFIHEDYLEL